MDLLSFWLSPGYFYFGREAAPEYEYAIAKRGDLVQEVSMTGKVKPAEAVDLAFEKSRKVAQVLAGVGNKVKAGQALARIDDADLKEDCDGALTAVAKSLSIAAHALFVLTDIQNVYFF